MIDVDKIQIGDKLRVDYEGYAYGGDSRYNIKAGTVLPVIQEDHDRGHWIDNKGVEVNYIDVEDAQNFTLVATNTKYSDISEGDVVEIACLSDEQISKWDCEYLIGKQGVVTKMSRNVHVDVDSKDVLGTVTWCLQSENLRVVEKADQGVGFITKTFEGALKADEGFNETNVDITPQSVDGVSALDKQISGTHYKSCTIQPIEYIHANGLDYFQGNVVKYVTRHKDKNGAADIKKAIHYLELILELQYKDE